MSALAIVSLAAVLLGLPLLSRYGVSLFVLCIKTIQAINSFIRDLRTEGVYSATAHGSDDGHDEGEKPSVEERAAALRVPALETTIKIFMQVLLSIAFGGTSLFIVLSKRYDATSKHFAYGTLGTLTGFWLNGAAGATAQRPRGRVRRKADLGEG